MTKSPVIRPFQSLALLSLVAASGILTHAQTPVQTPIQTPAPAATKSPSTTPAASAQDTPPARDNRHYTSKDLSVRPYSPAIPAPLYPSSQRKQSQFTVQYIFNYATSSYTPPVPLALVSRAAAKHDSPEAALTAYYSAMRSGDYEAWLQCWDEPSRKALEETTKQQKNGAEYWRALWRTAFANKRYLLIDRLETVNYIVLDTRIEDPAKPAATQTDSEVLVINSGKWTLTNAFSNDGLIMNYDGTASKVVKEYEIAPTKELKGPAALTGEAQKEFFARHTTVASVTKTAE